MIAYFSINDAFTHLQCAHTAKEADVADADYELFKSMVKTWRIAKEVTPFAPEVQAMEEYINSKRNQFPKEPE